MKALLCAAVATLALAAAETVIAPDRITRLYGHDAALEGGIRYQKGPNWLLVDGPGSVSWSVPAQAAGEFGAFICYASKTEVKVRLTVNGESFTMALPKTSGVFGDDLMNFERAPAGVGLKLASGPNRIRMEFESVVRLRSLELEPASARESIRRDHEAARAKRASTDWFAKAGYGLMFHWTSQSAPRKGAIKPYAQAVKEFDVAAFGQMVEETGARYVLFTANHADPHFPGPIRSWERIHPGTTTERDLIAEMSAELSKRKIRLMLYFASHTLGRLGKSTAAEYEQIHRDVLTEVGQRYGRAISGYWFDGWYQGLQEYPSLSLKNLWSVVKAGNPDRLVAYNFWLFPVETEWQEYWAAEVGGVVKIAGGRFLGGGPGKGLQYQNLIMADAPWVHSKVDAEMEAPRFKDDSLIEYVKGCMARQGVVTINLGIYQDGGIGDAAMKQMKALRRAIRGN